MFRASESSASRAAIGIYGCETHRQSGGAQASAAVSKKGNGIWGAEAQCPGVVLIGVKPHGPV